MGIGLRDPGVAGRGRGRGQPVPRWIIAGSGCAVHRRSWSRGDLLSRRRGRRGGDDRAPTRAGSNASRARRCRALGAVRRRCRQRVRARARRRRFADHDRGPGRARGQSARPARAAFGDLHVSVAPPTSQGFVLLQLLALLERLGIDPDLDGAAAGSIARVIEVANMDRDRHLADPDRMLVHPSTLLDDGHLAALADQARDARRHMRDPTATRSRSSPPTRTATRCP